MDEKLKVIFAEQEKEDAYRITAGIKEAVTEEFADAQDILTQMEHLPDKKHGQNGMADVLQYSAEKSFIRISSEFRIRKHTTCLVPYFHSHDFYEMIFVLQGECRQKIAGEQKELELFPGDLCVLTPGMTHAMMPCSGEDIILKLIIPGPMMKYLADSMAAQYVTSEENAFADCLKCKNRLYLFRSVPDTRFQLKELMLRLLHETYWGTSFRIPAIKSLLMLLLILLGRSGPEQTECNLLQKISVYIRQHIADVNREEVAKQFGYSGRQLGRKIAQMSDGTFSNLLWKIRMEEAAALLNETEIPVEEIAEKVGYHGNAGFYKRFEEMFHMTPAAYRKRYQSYQNNLRH